MSGCLRYNQGSTHFGPDEAKLLTEAHRLHFVYMSGHSLLASVGSVPNTELSLFSQI